MSCRIDPEELAYWYLRLNGFLTIENFILHDEEGRGQRTDIDLVAARFPHRREALRGYGDHEIWMEDDVCFSEKKTTFCAFVEVATRRCKLNGPWTDKKKANMPRALNALGSIPEQEINQVAQELYDSGNFQKQGLEVGLISIGSSVNDELQKTMPNVLQIEWDHIKGFIFKRFEDFERIKREHPQWDVEGHNLWELFRRTRTKEYFSASIELIAGFGRH